MAANTLYSFLKKCKKFSQANGITSDLKVDRYWTVGQLRETFDTSVGGIIAGIDNDVSDVIYKAIDYYEAEGNKKMADKFKELLND